MVGEAGEVRLIAQVLRADEPDRDTEVPQGANDPQRVSAPAVGG